MTEQEKPLHERTVYQVRAVTIHGHQRIVHSYESEPEGRAALEQMKNAIGRGNHRYILVPVKNNPTCHWGVKAPFVDPNKKKK
jgi:hypothetical protein